MTLAHLEEKVNILTIKLNWLLNHLGIDFPDPVLCKPIEQTTTTTINLGKLENDRSGVKENEKNQFSNLIKFRPNKRSSATSSPELKVYQNKKRISSTSLPSSTTTVVVNCDKLPKQISIPNNNSSSSSNRQKQQQQQQALEESSSSSSSSSSNVNHNNNNNNNNNSTSITSTPTSTSAGSIIRTDSDNETSTSYIITQNSPTADNEIEIETVKYEPLEVEISENPTNLEGDESNNNNNNNNNHNTTTVSNNNSHHHHHTVHIQEHETRYRIQEENNVLHIIKIEEPHNLSLDGEHTVINYSDAVGLPIVQIAHDGNSQLSAFSGEETAIGFLNPDGTVTPLNRPNVIINATSSASGIQQFEVLPLTPPTMSTPSKTVEEEQIDPKGTFTCQYCNQAFVGLFLYRQHEKKSTSCRRQAKLAKQKKDPSPVKNNNIPATSTVISSSGSSIVGKSSSVVGESASWKSSYVSNTSLPDVNSPVLKFKCSICGYNFASQEYLRVHMSHKHK